MIPFSSGIEACWLVVTAASAPHRRTSVLYFAIPGSSYAEYWSDSKVSHWNAEKRVLSLLGGLIILDDGIVAHFEGAAAWTASTSSSDGPLLDDLSLTFSDLSALVSPLKILIVPPARALILEPTRVVGHHRVSFALLSKLLC